MAGKGFEIDQVEIEGMVSIGSAWKEALIYCATSGRSFPCLGVTSGKKNLENLVWS